MPSLPDRRGNAQRPPTTDSWFASFGKPCTYDLESLVQIGTMGKAHGLKGDARCAPMTDFPERFLDTKSVHLHNGKPPIRTVEVESARFQGQKLILKLAGISRPEEVSKVCNYQVCVGSDELVELDDGEYYHFELEGLDVLDEAGEPVGTLVQVLDNPAHEIYLIDTPGGELMVPAVDAYVLGVDLEAGTVTIRRPILDEEDPCESTS